MYLRFQMQPPGTVEQVCCELLYHGPFVSLTPVRTLPNLIFLAANAQMYIFINDADDRVVECISISGLWS